jgi:hypothetical protein
MTMDKGTTDELPGRTCAALLTLRGRFALLIGGEARWRRDPGYVFIPLELPGGVFPANTPSDAAIAAIGERWLGCPLQVKSASVTYGSSAIHAIDRLPPRDPPAPLLFLERMAPGDPERGSGVRRVTVEVFHATTDGAEAAITPQDPCAGLLALSWQALRQVVRGLPLADLLARDDVSLRYRPGVTLPLQTLIYLTAEYGERMLLRVAAKYGVQALGKDIENGTGF